MKQEDIDVYAGISKRSVLRMLSVRLCEDAYIANIGKILTMQCGTHLDDVSS